METKKLFDLDKTIAKDLLIKTDYAWEILSEISEFIKKTGETLPKDKFEKTGEDIWIAKSASVAPTASLKGPLIIDEDAEVRHCAFIRGSVIVGKGAVVGNSTELKNAILFDKVQVPHYNYIGDSILGYKSHFGAGALTSNVKNDKKPVVVNKCGEKFETGLKKFGAIVGDFVEVGCHTVLCPGTVVAKNTSIYPLSMIRGYVKEDSIYKNNGSIVKKIEEQ